jgi:YgiT-type zinc finger domain-containing protein
MFIGIWMRLGFKEVASSPSSLPTPVEHQCTFCGISAIQVKKQVTRSVGKGANLLVVEGVPSWSCSNCGESYFTAKTMHEIQRIKTLRQSLAVKRSVSVAAFEVGNA